MPRIRSIKPEFATDGANLRLSDSCALFFILLWNFCDDEGKHPYDLNQLVAELGGRWHQGKVKLFVSCLIKSGQLRINSTSTWIQVTGWSHQKIDKPKQHQFVLNSLLRLQYCNHQYPIFLAFIIFYFHNCTSLVTSYNFKIRATSHHPGYCPPPTTRWVGEDSKKLVLGVVRRGGA